MIDARNAKISFKSSFLSRWWLQLEKSSLYFVHTESYEKYSLLTMRTSLRVFAFVALIAIVSCDESASVTGLTSDGYDFAISSVSANTVRLVAS